MATQPNWVFGTHGSSLGPARCAVTVALCTIALIGCGRSQGADGSTADARASASMAPDPDVRTAVVLPAQGRYLILEEMRGMLGSVQGFVTAAARGDTAAMRAAAAASGVAVARDMDPAMQHRLPEEFERLGMSTHAAWDSLAMAVSRGASTDQALARLGAVMGNCVACHTQFRINLERQAAQH